MYLNLCPQTIGLGNVSFSELVNLAMKYGFGGIDLPVHDLKTIDQAETAAAEMKKAGLNWGLFYLPCDFLQVDDAAFEQGLQQLETMLPIVQAAGCARTYNHVWPGSNEREFEENFKWNVERLKKLVALLGNYGVRIGIEFIGPKTLRDSFQYPFIYRLEQAVELADAVSPDLGLVLDCFHWYTSGGTLEDLRGDLRGHQIVNVHVNDAVQGRSRDEQLDLQRAMPLSTGLIDSPGVLKVLRELQYDGPVICEPFMPTLERFRGMTQENVVNEVSACMAKLVQRSIG